MFEQHVRDWLVFAAPMPHVEAVARLNNMIDPPKPCLSDSSWDLLSDYSMDAQEMLDAFNKGMDVLIDPKIGFVMACCVTSITRDVASRYNYIVIEADSGLTIHY